MKNDTKNLDETKAQLLSLMNDEYDFDRIYAWAKNFMAAEITFDKMTGFLDAVKELTTELHPKVDYSKMIDISGSGGSLLPTVNVSTIASFVLAAGGLVVAKQSTRAVTGISGSRDLLRAFGVDIMKQNDPKLVEQLLERHGLAFYYHPSFSTKFANQMQFFTDLKTKGLGFVTPWHLLFWVNTPLPLQLRLYGMAETNYLYDVARLFQRQGITTGLILTGGNMDEVSNTGATTMVEFGQKKLQEVILSPQDFGVRKALESEVTINSPEEAAKEAVRILYGHETGPKRDLVTINCAAAFKLASMAETWQGGRVMAEKLLADGSAAKKLEDYVAAVGDLEIFETLRKINR